MNRQGAFLDGSEQQVKKFVYLMFLLILLLSMTIVFTGLMKVPFVLAIDPVDEDVSLTGGFESGSLEGPVYPPPGGVEFDFSGEGLGLTGGLTFHFTGFDPSGLSSLYWGSRNDDLPGIAFDGLIDIEGEALVFDDNLSDFENGVLVFTGYADVEVVDIEEEEFIVITLTLDTRLTIVIEDDEGHVELTADDELGLTDIGGLAAVHLDGLTLDELNVNLLAEAYYEDAWHPVVELYDDLNTVEDDGVETSFNGGFYYIESQDVVSSVSLTAFPPSPTAPGQMVTFTADAVGGLAPVQYAFYYQLPGSDTWVLARDYSNNNRLSATPMAEGLYRVRVDARSHESTEDYEAQDIIDHSVEDIVIVPVDEVTLTVDPESPTAPGEEITFTAEALGGVNPEYAFYYRPAGTTAWTLVRDYSFENTFSASPAAVGDYQVAAVARSAGSEAIYEAYDIEKHTIAIPPVETVSLTADPPSPSAPGKSITFTAEAEGGLNPEYAFYYRMLPGGSWTLARDYSTDNTLTAAPTRQGEYYVGVRARSSGSSEQFEAEKVMNYWIKNVVVGSKEFTEQLILGQMTILALEEAGIPTVDQTGKGGTMENRRALEEGRIDLYWEYTGTALLNFFDYDKPITDPQECYDEVYGEDLKNGLVWLDYTPFNNTYTIMMRKADSDSMNITTISDLAQAINDNDPAPDPGVWSLASNQEYFVRDDGYPGLKDHYQFEFAEVVIREQWEIYSELRDEDVAAGVGFATDSRISAYDLVNLIDDQNFHPAYNAAPVVRELTLDLYPAIAAILNPITAKLDEETMSELNAKVDLDGETPRDVAMDWLFDKGFID